MRPNNNNETWWVKGFIPNFVLLIVGQAQELCPYLASLHATSPSPHSSPGLSATGESIGWSSLYSNTVITAHCQHLCKHVPVSIACVQGASRLKSGEDPGHGTSVFPPEPHLGMCVHCSFVVESQLFSAFSPETLCIYPIPALFSCFGSLRASVCHLLSIYYFTFLLHLSISGSLKFKLPEKI